MTDINGSFLQFADGNPRHYCKHGVFIGNPFGADLMCPWCESGEEPEPEPTRCIVAHIFKTVSKDDCLVGWELWQQNEVAGLKAPKCLIVAEGNLAEAEDCLRAALDAGWEPADAQSKIVIDAVHFISECRTRVADNATRRAGNL